MQDERELDDFAGPLPAPQEAVVGSRNATGSQARGGRNQTIGVCPVTTYLSQ